MADNRQHNGPITITYPNGAAYEIVDPVVTWKEGKIVAVASDSETLHVGECAIASVFQRQRLLELERTQRDPESVAVPTRSVHEPKD
jgi:hypothetical protein